MKKFGIFIVMLFIANSITVISTTNIVNKNQIESEFQVNYDYFKETYMVPMRDGIHLATDVYLPYEDYPEHGCILIRTPYNKDDIESYLEGQDYYIEEWLSDGWPFVVQDERGLYASEGEIQIEPGGAYYDGYDTVEWIASQLWSNGKIATWGRSAFGTNQYFMAGSAPPNLACQYVGVATSDVHKDDCFVGGELRKKLLEVWLTSDVFMQVCQNENFSYNFWGNMTLEDKWQNINVPAIHISGWYDMDPGGAIDAFNGYNCYGGQGALGKSKLIMGPWTHTQFGYNRSKAGDLKYPENQYDTFSRDMFKDMINQYTMDDTSNPFDDWPTVTYYTMGDVNNENATGNEWRYSDVWPITSDETCYYFHENGLLSMDIPGNYNPLTYNYDPENPVPTRGGQNLVLSQGPKDQTSVEDRDDVLLFTSNELTEPVGVTGPIKAILYVSSSCVDTDFTVKLTDVYPDGRSMLISDSIIRMRNRNGRDHWDFMIPGEIYEIEVDLFSTSYVWDTGHKIRVAVSSSNSPRFLANPNTGVSLYDYYQNPTYLVAENTLYINSEYPSCIVFPIVEEKGVLSKPDSGIIYFGDKEITQISSSNSIIIGKITIETPGGGYGIDRVEYYIDNEIVATDSEAPFNWLWDNFSFGKHTIKAIQYDHLENEVFEEINVLKFF